MVRSMTGFGRCELVENDLKIIVEMKAVNHRYLDLNIKLPKKFNAFESVLRNEIKKFTSRGKVDIYISYENYAQSNQSVRFNKDIAREYIEFGHEMEQEFGLDFDMRVSTLSRMPEVLTMEEATMDDEFILAELLKAFDTAGENFAKAKAVEGENLAKDLIEKLDNMAALVDKVCERSPQCVAEYRERLTDKAKELLAGENVDESRILTEVMVFADKICVDEETVRLKSHIATAKKELNATEGVGRKLDFIAQEMNREANTILSKCNDLELSNIGIDLKNEIEKVREQIQNIE